MNTCTATRKDGSPCTAPAMRAGSSRCFAHDEALQAQRLEARAKGGRSKSKIRKMRRLMPSALLPAYDQLETALGDVLSGELDPKRASAAAALARAMCAVLMAGELEQRVRDLEARNEPARPHRQA